MRHRTYDRLGCPVEACTEAIGGRWKGKIIFSFHWEKRHGELRKLIPDATQRILTLQLCELEEDGIVGRKVYPVAPPKVEYSITRPEKASNPSSMPCGPGAKTFLITCQRSD